MACTISVGNELPQDLNVTIYQGGSFNEVILWTDGSGTPVDLTGYSGLMKVKQGSTTVVTLSTSGTGIALGGTAGTITLSIDAADTTALPAPANCVYDLLLTSAGGFVYPLVAGLCNIRPGVSAV